MAGVRIDPLRGFRDLLHPYSTLLTRLMNVFARRAESYGYLEVKPPTLERFEIFAVKSGEEIRKSMYVFRDKAGREVALRPEATASVARIYLRHLRAWPKPIRLYYIINCFRYEEPQRARYREFWQAGLELIGLEGVEGDFEVIRVLLSFYKDIDMLKHIVLKIGNTRVYRELFNHFRLREEVQDRILHLMDKELYDAALEEASREGEAELASLLKELWSKARSDMGEAREIVSSVSASAAKAIEELESLVEMLREYMPDVKLAVDLSFARGLAYYTGVIFEVKVPGFPVSIAGGGRYDDLVSVYGGERVPGTGFAIGLDRTLSAIMELRLKPRSLYSEPDRVAVIALSNSYLVYASRIQDILAERYITTLVKGAKLNKVMSRLVKQGYKYVVIAGEKEVRENKVTVKDLEARRQLTVSLEVLASTPMDRLFKEPSPHNT